MDPPLHLTKPQIKGAQNEAAHGTYHPAQRPCTDRAEPLWRCEGLAALCGSVPDQGRGRGGRRNAPVANSSLWVLKTTGLSVRGSGCRSHT